MARNIDADKLLEKQFFSLDDDGFGMMVVSVTDIISAPTVDAVEVVHGEWLFGELDMLGASVKCSNCGFGVDCADPILWMDYPGHRFCGACGAKMDGGDTNDER